jgi:hypothetical protein
VCRRYVVFKSRTRRLPVHEGFFSSSARGALGLSTYQTRRAASVRTLFRMTTLKRQNAYTHPERRQERGVIVCGEKTSVDGVVAHGMGREN